MNCNFFLSDISTLGGMISKFTIFMIYMFKYSASLASLLYRHLPAKLCTLPFSLKKTKRKNVLVTLSYCLRLSAPLGVRED